MALFLIPIGIYACIRDEMKGRFLLGSFIGFFSILLTYGRRYFLHAPIINSAIASLGYKRILGKLKSRKFVVSLTLAFLAFNSLFNITLAPTRPRGPPSGRRRVEMTPLMRELTTITSKEPRAWGVFNLNNPDLIALAEWIKENTKEDEIIHVRVGPLADSITLLTGRRTDHGMYPEVRTEEMFRAIAEGRKSGVFVLTKNQLKGIGLFEIKYEVLAVFGILSCFMLRVR